MQYSKHPRLMLEMAFVKATQAGNVVPVTELLARVDGLLQGAASDEPAVVTSGVAPSQSAEPIGRFSASQQNKPGEAPGPPAEVGQHQPEADRGNGTKDTDQEVQGRGAEKKNVRQSWNEFIDYVMDRKKWMAHVLRLCSGVRQEKNVLVMKFDEKADCKMLQTPEHMKTFVEFAQDFFQQELKITIKVRGSDTVNNNGNPVPQEERRALANDPLVQMTTDIFDGRVVNIRTGPRSR